MKITNYTLKNYPSNVLVFLEYQDGSSFGCLDIHKEYYSYINEIEEYIIYHIEKNEDNITKKLAKEIAKKVKWYF